MQVATKTYDGRIEYVDPKAGVFYFKNSEGRKNFNKVYKIFQTIALELKNDDDYLTKISVEDLKPGKTILFDFYANDAEYVLKRGKIIRIGDIKDEIEILDVDTGITMNMIRFDNYAFYELPDNLKNIPKCVIKCSLYDALKLPQEIFPLTDPERPTYSNKIRFEVVKIDENLHWGKIFTTEDENLAFSYSDKLEAILVSNYPSQNSDLPVERPAWKLHQLLSIGEVPVQHDRLYWYIRCPDFESVTGHIFSYLSVHNRKSKSKKQQIKNFKVGNVVLCETKNARRKLQRCEVLGEGTNHRMVSEY